MKYTVTITFMDGSTRQRTYTSKREALAEERRAIKSRIVLFATTKGETA
jgi:hypothetical protein